MPSSVVEVVASSPGGREFCSCAIMNRVSIPDLGMGVGISPVGGENGFTGTIEHVNVAFDGPIDVVGNARFYLRVAREDDATQVYQNLLYFTVELFSPSRPVFFNYDKPLNFVVPPGYILMCYYVSDRPAVTYLSTANVRWRSYNVV